jgi:hypothetical protein
MQTEYAFYTSCAKSDLHTPNTCYGARRQVDLLYRYSIVVLLPIYDFQDN